MGNELRVQTGGERCSDLGVTEEQKLPPDEVGVTGATDDEVQVSDPEVIAKPVTRRFTAADKIRILAEADQCKHGELGALCRREGIYFSTLCRWRKQREIAMQALLAPQKPGPKPQEHTPLEERVAQLEKENAQLRQRLKQAETIIEVQKKSPRY